MIKKIIIEVTQNFQKQVLVLYEFFPGYADII